MNHMISSANVLKYCSCYQILLISNPSSKWIVTIFLMKMLEVYLNFFKLEIIVSSWCAASLMKKWSFTTLRKNCWHSHSQIVVIRHSATLRISIAKIKSTDQLISHIQELLTLVVNIAKVIWLRFSIRLCLLHIKCAISFSLKIDRFKIGEECLKLKS